MNIHEYQAKSILAKFGVSVPRGGIAFTPEEAVLVAKDLGGPVWVVKAQIHAGGRGKGGGVKVVRSIEEVRAKANDMLGSTLITSQTGPGGRLVSRVYIEEGADISRELYLSVLIDRRTSCVTLLGSTEGGMDIEEVAATAPEKIVSISIDPASGIQPYHARRIAFALGLNGTQVRDATRLVMAIYQSFMETDASLLEINPLIVTGTDKLLVLDAKMNFDDNALFRREDIVMLRDEAEEDPTELEAAKNELNYIKLDGSIGCMVNGAGLAMATMDIIKLYGGEPSNFLDVGGGASKERVTAAFRIILSDVSVKGILVNIFGGIMRCDVIAEGIVAAAADVSLKVPLVVRLAGTNVDLGQKILDDSTLNVIAATDLGDAAKKIVQAVSKVT